MKLPIEPGSPRGVHLLFDVYMRAELNQRSIGALSIVPPTTLRKIIRYLPNSLGDPLDDTRSAQRFEPPNVRFHEAFRIIVALSFRSRVNQMLGRLIEPPSANAAIVRSAARPFAAR